MLSPGRDHDLKALQDRIHDKQTSEMKRNSYLKQMDRIRLEDKHPDIMDLRRKLIEATRANDQKFIDYYSNKLRDLSRKKGLTT